MLLAVHAAILLSAAPRQAPTICEVWHLPAGISYWQRGEFWCYHHNPPVMRWLTSWPAIVAGAEVDYSRYVYRPKSRSADFEFGRDFLVVNRERYLDLFCYCRPVVMLVSVACGWLIWRWSRSLFGDLGGLISLWLWVFLPESLTHGMLLTTDMGAAFFGFLATWLFWRYLRAPSLVRALVSGIALGVAEGTKFSCMVLPLAWAGLAVVRFVGKTPDASFNGPTEITAGKAEPLALSPDHRSDVACHGAGTGADGFVGWRAILGHALVVFVTSIVVLNDLYLFEGFGKPLGEFPFFSHTLTQPGRQGPIGNRFQGTWLARLPVPLPEQYLLGFDAQLADLDRGEYQKYLRGELKKGDGWWYYYAYACLVKLPLGTLGIATLAMVVFVQRRVLGTRRRGHDEPEAIRFQACHDTGGASSEESGASRHPAHQEQIVVESAPHPHLATPGRGGKATATPLPWRDELAVIVPGLVFFLSVSSNTGLQYFRYLLVCFPFLCVFCGRLGLVLECGTWKRRFVLLCLLLSIPISVLRHHPYYLPYFNEAVGGPEGGPQHLAECNIDWGEGLLALRDWLQTHRPGEPLRLAYCGMMAPQVAGFDDYELPPFGPGFQVSREHFTSSENDAAFEIGPVPGLQSVSVNYVLGISFPTPNGRDLTGIAHVPQGAYSYFTKFQPIAKPGYSMWVFDLSVEDVNRVRADLGLPAWRPTEVVNGPS